MGDDSEFLNREYTLNDCKKYLPVLKKMRIDEPSLKRFTNRDNNGQNITFWQYIE